MARESNSIEYKMIMPIPTRLTEIHLKLNGYSWASMYLFFPQFFVDEVITRKIFEKRGVRSTPQILLDTV